MARNRCSCLLDSAANVIFWLVISASFFVPLAIVGREVYSAFYGPGAGVYRLTGVEQMSNELLCTPMWQKPFNYEVKVYASLKQDAFNNPQEFFGSAQLLWHSESASLDNQYPKLATTAAVKIPSTLYSADSINATLYAHIFIQAASNLVPHPDVHDTSLVHSTAHLARWRPISKSGNRTDDNSKLFELVAATKLPWATILENHTFKLKELPSYISKVSGALGVGGSVRSVYKPPVFENTFTEFRGTVKQLALLNLSGSMVFLPNKTHAVQLKIQGIHSGWMQLFKVQPRVVDMFNSVVTFSLPNLNPPAPKLDSGFRIPIAFVEASWYKDISLKSQLILCTLIILSWAVTILQDQAALVLWLSSRSAWDGISRISTFVAVSGMVLESVIGRYSKDDVMNFIRMGFALSALLRMVDLPARPWKWPSYFSKKMSLYRQAAAHSSSDDKQDPQLATIRRGVDYSVFKWICALGFPAVIALATHMHAYSKERVWSMAFIAVLIGRVAKHCNWIRALPQLLLNYTARSGALFPPAISIGLLCSQLIDIGVRYNISVTGFAISPEEWSGIISSIIFVVQWLVYR